MQHLPSPKCGFVQVRSRLHKPDYDYDYSVNEIIDYDYDEKHLDKWSASRNDINRQLEMPKN